MTNSDPVERVVAYLEGFGYRRLPSPLMINRMTFQFPAVLAGAEKSNDLILVADTVGVEDVEIVRLVQGVARALDVARSNNPLTTVIVGPRPGPEDLSKMMEVCRVLPLGPIHEKDSDQVLANWLAVLTPLDQIDTGGVIVEPIEELRSRLDDLPDEIAALAVLSRAGVDAVEQGVNALLTQELELAWESKE